MEHHLRFGAFALDPLIGCEFFGDSFCGVLMASNQHPHPVGVAANNGPGKGLSSARVIVSLEDTLEVILTRSPEYDSFNWGCLQKVDA